MSETPFEVGQCSQHGIPITGQCLRLPQRPAEADFFQGGDPLRVEPSFPLKIANSTHPVAKLRIDRISKGNIAVTVLAVKFF
jgi:hypothetical protein